MARVAGAISARYGLPKADLEHRIGNGKFCVKSGIDLEAAERLAHDLERMGAVCTIEDEFGRSASRGSVPQREERPGELQSGLAAASLGAASEQDLGALGLDNRGLSLATLDGQDDELPAPGLEAVAAFEPSAFSPPEAGAGQGDLQLAIDPKAEARRRTPPPFPAAPEPSQQTNDGLGPVVTGASIPVGLEQTNVPPPLEPMHQMPPQMAQAGAGNQAAMPHQGQAGAPGAPYPPNQALGAVLPGQAPARSPRARAGGAVAAGDLVKQGLGKLAAAPRIRYAVGVFLALFIGFLPAHIFASIREGGVYDRIDKQVEEDQAQVVTIDEWTALDDARAEHLASKKSAQRSIALGGIIVWLLVGGALGFVWFRLIDWDAYRLSG